MPNKVQDSAREKIHHALIDVLRGIDLASGFNTQPHVTDDPDEALEPDKAQHVLYVHQGPEKAKDKHSGPRWYMGLEFIITGYAWRGKGTEREELNKVLQDVRNALCLPASLSAMKTATAMRLDLDLGDVDVDDGEILGDGLTGFVLEVEISYFAGAQW